MKPYSPEDGLPMRWPFAGWSPHTCRSLRATTTTAKARDPNSGVDTREVVTWAQYESYGIFMVHAGNEQ